MHPAMRKIALATTVSAVAACAVAAPAVADWGQGNVISGAAKPTDASIAVAPLPGADALAVFADSLTDDVLWQRFDSDTGDWLATPGTVHTSNVRTANTALAAYTDGGAAKVRAVWRAGGLDASGDNTIMTSVYDVAGDTWSTAEPVGGVDNAWGESPKVTVGTGETYVAWNAEGSGSVRISRLLDDQSAWDTAALEPVSGLARNINVVVDSNGTATATWTVDGSPYVWVSRRASGDGESWSTPSHVAEPDTNAGFSDDAPRLVVAPNNVLTVAFTRVGRDGGNVVSRDIYATRYDPAAQSPAWTTPDRVSREGENSFSAVPAVDASGAVTLAWDASLGTHADGATGVLASRFDPSAQSPSWTTAEVIAEDAAQRPLSVTQVGTATMVTWRGSRGLVAVRRAASGTWSAPTVVDATGQSQVVAGTSSNSAMFLFGTQPYDDQGRSYAGAGARYLVDSGAAPGVPQGVTAVQDRDAINVQFSAPADLGYWGAATYRVAASPGNATCSSSTTSCTFTGLDAAQEYTFTVTATGPGGTSAASQPSNAVRPGGSTAPSGTKLWWGNWGYALNGLSMSTLSGTFGDTVVPGVSAWGTSADPAQGRVYFVDRDVPAVKWINADGTGQPDTLTTAHSPTDGLSLDTTTGTIYWTTGDAWSSTADSIARANTADPNDNGVLYDSTDPAVRTPAAVVADPANDRLYWANHADGTVGYGDLNNAGNTDVITVTGCPSGRDLTKAYSVAVDQATDSLYVAGEVSGGGYALLAARMDGSNCGVLATSASEILGLAVDTDQNRVYYAADSSLAYVSLATPGTSTPIFTSALVDYPGFPLLVGVPSGAVTLSSTGTETGSMLTCAVEWAADAPQLSMYRAPKDVTFSWRKDGAPLAGATGTTVEADAAGAYECAATGANASGEATERSSAITIAAPPAPDPAPAPAPAPAPTPPSVAPSAPAPALTANPLAPPAIAPAGDNRTRLTFRLKLSQAGRYTFILQQGTTPAPLSGRRGKRSRLARPEPPRVEFLAGSKIGDRTLTAPSSAPVMKGAKAGQDLIIVAFINGTPPSNLMLNAVAASRMGGLQGSLFPVAG